MAGCAPPQLLQQVTALAQVSWEDVKAVCLRSMLVALATS